MSEGGYLVPEYIMVDRPGLRAFLWRMIGKLLNRPGWYLRGRNKYNLHNHILDFRNRCNIITEKAVE